jgi:DNA-binding IclR family transcriptional regulator
VRVLTSRECHVPASVQSVERAAAMLRLLADEEEPLGLGQIATALDLAKGTAHGLLRTLTEVGFVRQEPGTGRYAVAMDFLTLGATRLDINELRARALNWTDVLAARTGAAASVAVFRDGRAVRAHHVLAGQPGRSASTAADQATSDELVTALQATLPLHASALGKVLLAYDPGAGRMVADGGADLLVRFTRSTVTDRVQLYRALAELRDCGWAAEVDEQRPGRSGIAAPVRDRGGHVVAAVGIEGPTAQVCEGRTRPAPALVGHVQRAAQAISRELGHGRA